MLKRMWRGIKNQHQNTKGRCYSWWWGMQWSIQYHRKLQYSRMSGYKNWDIRSRYGIFLFQIHKAMNGAKMDTIFDHYLNSQLWMGPLGVWWMFKRLRRRKTKRHQSPNSQSSSWWSWVLRIISNWRRLQYPGMSRLAVLAQSLSNKLRKILKQIFFKVNSRINIFLKLIANGMNGKLENVQKNVELVYEQT